MKFCFAAPRLAIIFALLTGFVLLVAALGALALPRLIDSALIKTWIHSEFVKKTSANVAIGKIALHWSPRPVIQLESVEISSGSDARGTIPRATLYPSIWALLRGRLFVHQAVLNGPRLIIRLPEPAAKPFNVDEFESQVRSALNTFTRELPVTRFELVDGAAEVRIGNRPPLILSQIAGRTFASADEVRFDLSARANLLEQVKLDGEIDPQSLAGRFGLAVLKLKIREAIALVPSISAHALSGEASLAIKVAAAGMRSIKASIDNAAGRLVLGRDNETALEAKRLKGSVTYESGVFVAKLAELELTAPALQASGEFRSQADSFSAALKIRGMDIAETSKQVLAIRDDRAVQNLLRYVSAGKVTEASIQTTGRSLAEMTARKNLRLSAILRDGRVFVPALDLQLENASGSVRFAGDMLEADGVSASLGAIKAWNGKLRLGIDGDAAPLRLDLSFSGAAAQLHALLLKIARDQQLRNELLKLRGVEGELAGTLQLGDRMDALSPVIAISQGHVSATYDPILYPVVVKTGRFNYDGKRVSLGGADGSFGASSFDGLGFDVERDTSRRLNLKAKRLSLDLQQSRRLLRSFRSLREHAAEIQAARGQIEFHDLTLTGPYDEPTAWTIASGGSFKQVGLRLADLPEPLALTRGNFDVRSGRITVSDATGSLSDGALTGAVTFEYKQRELTQIEADVAGTLGGRMTQWLGRRAGMPQELNLRAPLRIAAAHLSWQPTGDISLRGRVSAASGPRFFIDAVKQSQATMVRDFVIDDEGRNARLRLRAAKERVEFSFNGELAAQTLDKIFTSSPIKSGSLRGKIQANIPLGNLLGMDARGQLSGTQVSLPWRGDQVMLEKFAVDAQGDNARIRSAEVRWRGSSLSLAGSVAAKKDVLLLDLDIFGHHIDLTEAEALFTRAEEGSRATLPRVEGTIRLKADRLRSNGYRIEAVEASAAISSAAIRGQIARGMICGVAASGNFESAGADMAVDLSFATTDGELEATSLCLTDQRSDVKGKYNFKARINGRGDRASWRSALKGDFKLDVRDGEFVRGAGMDATFDYLNQTGDFAVAFPDLTKQTFPFRALTINGRIDGENVLNDEIVLQASPYTITGQGRVDLAKKQVDVKGLVSVALPVHDVIKRIPLIGALVGGTLVGIPIRVSGPLERPVVAYLAPQDVGAELINVPLRILGSPLDALKLFVPSASPP